MNAKVKNPLFTHYLNYFMYLCVCVRLQLTNSEIMSSIRKSDLKCYNDDYKVIEVCVNTKFKLIH